MWWIMIITLVLCFGGFFFSFKQWGMGALFCFAIGGAVNANFFHANAYQIVIGSLQFGIDSIVYTLFAFCLLVAFLKFSKSQAMVLLYSSMGAIAFAGVCQFMGDWAISGEINQGVLISLGSFVASIIGTYLAVWLSLWVCQILKDKNIPNLLIIMLGIFLISVINSLIYYGLFALVSGGMSENFISVLISSYIGKFVSLFASMFVWFVVEKTTSSKTRYHKVDKIEEN